MPKSIIKLLQASALLASALAEAAAEFGAEFSAQSPVASTPTPVTAANPAPAASEFTPSSSSPEAKKRGRPAKVAETAPAPSQGQPATEPTPTGLTYDELKARIAPVVTKGGGAAMIKFVQDLGTKYGFTGMLQGLAGCPDAQPEFLAKVEELSL